MSSRTRRATMKRETEVIPAQPGHQFTHPTPPAGCWKTFQYHSERGVHLCLRELIWFSLTNGQEQRLVQQLEAFHRDGAPVGVISKSKERRLREILRIQPKSNPMQPLIDSLKEIALSGDMPTAPDCANCGQVPILVSFECLTDPITSPHPCPSLSVISSGGLGATATLMRCSTCDSFFHRWYSECGADFTPTGKSVGTAVTLRRVSVAEAIQYLERGW